MIVSLTHSELSLFPYDEIVNNVEQLVASTNNDKHNAVWIPETCNHAIASCVPELRRFSSHSPVAMLKSLKNETEIAGARRCQLRDGVVLAQFFVWLEKAVHAGAQHQQVTELSASHKLEELRSQQPNYVSLSFETIAGAGPNGAVVHYKADENSNRTIMPSDVFLLDSGSQYEDGTTDITRTVHLSTPSNEQRETYTRVLQGHIQLAMAKFPNKTTGHRLDALARKPLWDVGLDYQHGTGHGVGAFLNVHEGPQSISMRYSESDPGLQAGMIVTDEPGYYEAGAYGIRIESDMLVVRCPSLCTDRAEFLQLDPLTIFPIQTKMVSTKLMSAEEIGWLNNYHQRCRDELLPVLKEQNLMEEYKWLERETMPVS